MCAPDNMSDRMVLCVLIPEKIVESTGNYPVFCTWSDQTWERRDISGIFYSVLKELTGWSAALNGPWSKGHRTSCCVQFPRLLCRLRQLGGMAMPEGWVALLAAGQAHSADVKIHLFPHLYTQINNKWKRDKARGKNHGQDNLKTADLQPFGLGWYILLSYIFLIRLLASWATAEHLSLTLN